MAPRFKTGLVLAFMLVFLYVLFARDDRPLGSGEHAVDRFGESQTGGNKGGYGTNGEVWTPTNDEFGVPVEEVRPLPTYVLHTATVVPSPSVTDMPEFDEAPMDEDVPEFPPVEDAPEFPPPFEDALETPAAVDEQDTPENQDAPVVEDNPGATYIPIAPEETVVIDNSTSLQDQFMAKYEALGSTQGTMPSIYGNTLRTLVDNNQHAGFAFKMLTPTEEPVSYSEKDPYTYNPYPDYNSKNWKSLNQGKYKACKGPQGDIVNLLVFSGHPQIFDRKGPHLGSNIVLGIDDNLCFERETRLGPYGFSSTDLGEETDNPSVDKRSDWDSVDWGKLQRQCFAANAPRYNKTQPVQLGGASGIPGISVPANRKTNMTRPLNEVGGQTFPRKRDDEINDEEEARKKGLHGMPKITAQVQQRTAVLIRTHSAQIFTENDKQNIRSLITELNLGSGAEYEVFLLVQVKDAALFFRKNAEHKKTALENIPQEFRGIAVLWNDAEMKMLYQFVPEKANNVHQSQWLSVQAFAQIAGYSKYDFYWNWEFDSRYTGHHYNLFEKLAAFAKVQPRKGLWERNERYFVEAIHARWPRFKIIVEKISGLNTIWGPVPIPNLEPVGPEKPDYLPERDKYEWGVGEDADYISLAPMFNPVNTTWVGRNDVWGYDGTNTPRRATIGTQSRCSKKLLDAMHYENMRGNHVSSEMTPSTVALLHGLKAVFAPIPVFFDRAWKGKDLDRFFNPGPKGVSGSTVASPFSWGMEGRFKGSTWYFRADPPQRLYNNWLGWADSGIGGSEWEETNGRTCLPPMLMHPIKNVVQPDPDYSSVSELPY